MIRISKFIEGLHVYLEKAFAPFKGRLAALEAKLAELEARVESFSHKGVWSPGTYQRHNFVTDHGSMWVCRADRTTQRPGDGGDWSLAVKHGRDARG